MTHLKLRINEVNKLQFKLSIKGITSNQNQTKPDIRFILSSKKADKTWLFPAEMKDSLVEVSIPEMAESLKENEECEGKLEVILGNRYFVPATVNIIFESDMEIKADTLSVNEEQQTKAQINKESISEVKEESSQTLIKEIKQEVKEEVVDLLPKLIKDIIFTQPQQISKQFVSESPKTKIKTPLKSHKVQQKEYLKNLIFEAWKDF